MSLSKQAKIFNVRRRSKSVSLAVVLVLALSAFLAFSPSVAAAGNHITTASSVPLSQSMRLRYGDYQGFQVNSFSNNTTVAYASESNAPISVALMTDAQYNQFANDLSDPISNSINYANGTSIQNNVTITTGVYWVVFYAYYSRAVVDFGLQTTPNTPYSYGPLSSTFASGISTFGLSNSSGVVSSYQVQTTEVVGIANISSMQVYTPNAEREYGVSDTGATLQLNTVLVVNDASGQKVYWAQNVPDFETGPSTVSIGDEIWNWTDNTGFLSNQTVTSPNLQNGGAVYPTGEGNSGPYVYNYNGPNETYSTPLNLGLLVSETVLPNQGVLVQFGDEILANASGTTTTTINWFDNVTLVDPSVQSAYFDVSGGAVPPIGLFYDTELVFGGEGNGAVAQFTQLQANLGLYYQSSSSPTGILSSFPTYYSFSGDTGESADDLVVTYSNGIASVGTGVNPNYTYLGSGTQTLNLQTMTSSTLTTASAHYNNPTGVEATTGQYTVGQGIQFAVTIPYGSPLPTTVQAFVNGVGQSINQWSSVDPYDIYIYTAQASTSLIGSTSVYAVLTFANGLQVTTNSATLVVTA